MKTITNFIVTFMVFLLGSTLFPNALRINSYETIFIATVLTFIIVLVLDLLLVSSVFLIPLGGLGCLSLIVVWVLKMFVIPLELYILDRYVSGFSINSGIAYFWITLALIIFRVPDTNKN